MHPRINAWIRWASIIFFAMARSSWRVDSADDTQFDLRKEQVLDAVAFGGLRHHQGHVVAQEMIGIKIGGHGEAGSQQAELAHAQALGMPAGGGHDAQQRNG